MRTLEPLRSAVRRELGRTEPPGRRCRVAAGARRSILAVSLIAALAVVGGEARASGRWYAQVVLPGLSALDAGLRAFPELVDMDGDGDLDAVVGSLYNGMRYYENTGSPAAPAYLGRPVSGNLAAGLSPGSSLAPAFADLDGDGDLDAVVGQDLGQLHYFRNTGSPVDPEWVEITGTASPFSGFLPGYRSAPELADLDGDGDLDAVVGAHGGTLFYLENTGSTSAPAYLHLTGSANPFAGLDVGFYSSPGLADLDADGDLDAVSGSHLGAVHYFRNTGSSTAPAFADATGTGSPFAAVDAGSYSTPELADVDDDGDLDAVVGEYNGLLRYFENTGQSTAPAYAQVTDTSPFGRDAVVTYHSSPSLADLDGDADLDAVVGRQNGTLSYFRNTGSSTAPAYLEVSTTANPLASVDVTYRSSPALADVDGDGDLDAVVGEYNGLLRYFENTGNSTAPAYLEATGTANAFAAIDVGDNSSPALADVDGDGDLDTVVAGDGGPLGYFRNTGSSTTPAYIAVTGSANPFSGVVLSPGTSHALADVDLDGDLDLAVGEEFGSVRYFRNTGSSTAPAYVEVTDALSNPFLEFSLGIDVAPELADVDGDGDPDLLLGGPEGVLVYLRSPAHLFADGFESGDTSAWTLTLP